MSDRYANFSKALVSAMQGVNSMFANKVTIERSLHRIGMLLEANIKAKISNIGLVDQGALLNSIRYSVKMQKDGGVVRVGSYGVVYAAIHEFGGVITPKQAGALTIPMAPWAKGRRARDFKLVRIGSLLVDPKRLERGSNRIPDIAKGFALVKSVRIPQRSYMRSTIKDQTPNIIKILRELGRQQ
jgi:phage gpG-like protein